MLLFILLVVVVFGGLIWLVTRSRRKTLSVNEPPTNPRQAIDEVSDTGREPGRRPLR